MKISEYPEAKQPSEPQLNPAKNLKISSAENGWVIARLNVEGIAVVRTFVCKSADEVADTVAGLITTGTPTKKSPPGRDAYTYNEGYNSGVAASHGTLEALTKDLRSARSDADHYKAFSEQCNEENARLKQARGDRDTLIKRVDELIGQREAAIKGWAKEATDRKAENAQWVKNRTQAADYQQGHDDASCEVRAIKAERDKYKERADALSTGQGVLRNEKAQLMGELQVSHMRLGAVQKELTESNRVRSELCQQIEGYKRSLELLSPRMHFQPGDVWRTDKGVVRCISSISPLRYIQSGPILCPNHSEQKTVNLQQLRDYLEADGTPRVYRGNFSPAQHDGEPAEGFMVGDVWTSGQDVRKITSVSENRINYDHIFSEGGSMPDWLCRPCPSPTWVQRVGDRATLERR